jgi:hypothetical protein
MAMEMALERILKETSSPTFGTSQDTEAAETGKAPAKPDFFASIRKACSSNAQKASTKQRAQSLVTAWLSSEMDCDSDCSLEDATFLGMLKLKVIFFSYKNFHSTNFKPNKITRCFKIKF